MSDKTIKYISEFIENCRNNREFSDSVVPKKNRQKAYYISRTFENIRDQIVREQYNRIQKAFGFDDNEQAWELFRYAACGSGNEWLEINQLNSSALLSFLCFHRVSPELPITIGGEEYNKVMFEVKSPLEKDGRSRPVSNMDVVLLNDNSALFLESKLCEYLKPKNVEVSAYYNKYYSEVFDKNLEFTGFRFENQKWVADGEGAYMEGVKQMISHYLGLRHSSKDINWYKGLFRDKKIKLAEIVYRFGQENNSAEEFKKYKEISSQLFSRLGKDAKEHQIEVFPSILTYQAIFSDPNNASLLLKRVKEFYNMPDPVFAVEKVVEK